MSDAGANMTTPLEMLDLAHRLLACEAAKGDTFKSGDTATVRVYEKLRLSLSSFAGAAGFQSLASRALVLAKSEVPALSSAQVATNGSLQGLGRLEAQIVLDKDRPGKNPADDGEIILIARLLGLLLTLLGEALTLSLLRNAWPGADFDDRSSGNGRKA